MLGGLAISDLVGRLLTVYGWIIIIYVLMSWFPIHGGILLDAYRALGTICEPYLALFRRILPASVTGGSGLDFSPLVAILVLNIVNPFIVTALRAAGL
jgi:YggT family protein